MNNILNPEETYHRKNHILYDSQGNKIVQFDQKSADADNLTGDLVVNMNTYIKCYPERVEIFDQKKENVQLNLF